MVVHHIDSESIDVAVIGGGPAGLAHAFWRQQRDANLLVVVFERRHEPGGHVRTRNLDGCSCEWGPQGIRPTPALDALVDAMGIRDLLVDASPAAQTRWIGKRGRLYRAPRGPGSFLASGVLPLLARLRAVREPWIRQADAAVSSQETLAEFVTRRFGAGLVPMADAMVGGIYAGAADALEVASAFPAIVEMERESGSLVRTMMQRAAAKRAARREAVDAGGAAEPESPPPPALQTFEGGMQTLTDLLAERLNVRCGEAGEISAVRRDMTRGWVLERDNAPSIRVPELVVATPAPAAAALLKSADSALSTELGGIPTASVVSVHVRAKTDLSSAQQRGFGFLRMPGDGISPVLGVIYVSEVFPGHAPPGFSTFRVMMGGARDPEILAKDDGVLHAQALDALRSYAGVEDPEIVGMDRVARAIPQYVRGHADRITNIQKLVAASTAPLRLIGNSYDGIALGDQLGPPPPPPAPEERT